MLQKKIIWGIKLWQLLAMLLFYIFFAFQYWFAIWFTGSDNILPEVSIDYLLLKPLITIPLWWLYFIKWKNKKLAFKICMHLITAPVWIFIWFFAYRYIQDLRNDGYLQGDGIWWDIYIPFLVYCIQFAVFHVYDYYLQNQKQKQREQLLTQAAHNSEVSALKAQIQPHFLFNTLNSISASVPVEMENTRELIAKLADTFRYSLKASENEFLTLGEELNFIKYTLDLEKVRLKERLTITYNIDEHALPYKVPSMILQPITENATKHGIAPSILGGEIFIDIKKVANYIYFSISNTGIEYSGDINENIFEKGIGLRNTNQRLKMLYNEKINVEKITGGGLKFTFKIPV